MSTEGFLTFVAGGVEISSFNKWSSCPRHLGLRVLRWLREAVTDPDALAAAIARLRYVDSVGVPTAEEIQRFHKYVTRNEPPFDDLYDWYYLLRDTQSDPAMILEAGLITDIGSMTLPWDPGMHYGYVIDTDTRVFEVYEGPSDHTRRARGRFAEQPAPGSDPDGSPWPAAMLVLSWPFDALPTDDAFLAATANI
ncbi:hypothetical protein [Nocardia puris]|uniref:hypothetical protein n=1 Tax=Nocardia puris TaxID=208602 RepID=UPI002E1BC04E